MTPEDRIMILSIVERIRADLKILEYLLRGGDAAEPHLQPAGMREIENRAGGNRDEDGARQFENDSGC